MTNFDIISKAFRHNSGKSILDSGDFYGRHYEKPPISESTPMIKLDLWNDEINATIESAHMLSEFFTVDKDIQAQFEEWLELPENEDLNWFEAGERFVEDVLGLFKQSGDNTYNSENDLSQDYQWSVYTDLNDNDWLYASDSTLTVVHAHTGCDIRGGYSYPLFLRSMHDYSVPLNITVEYHISQGRRNGVELDSGECSDLCYEWENGYSSNPSYMLSKAVKRVFKFTKTDDSVVALLNDGAIVKIHPNLYIG
jgi:hypothetical protein